MTLRTVPGPRLPSGMCEPVTSVQMHVFTLVQTTPRAAPRLPLAFLTASPYLRQLQAGTQCPSSLSGYPLQLRAASSRVEVTPDQVGGASAPWGRMSQGRRQAAVGQLAQIGSPTDGLSRLSVYSCLLKAFLGVSTGVRRLPLSCAAIDPGTQSPSHGLALCLLVTNRQDVQMIPPIPRWPRKRGIPDFLLTSLPASLGTSVDLTLCSVLSREVHSRN